MKTIYFALLLINLFWTSPSLALQSGEGVLFDPTTGDYIISYRYTYEPGNPLYQVRFAPSTKIDPTLLSRFRMEREGQIRFSYTIINGAQSRQPLIDFAFGEISAVTLPANMQPIIAGVFSGEGLSTPAGWDIDMFKEGLNYSISWIYHDLATRQDGLQPGKSQGGFGFISPDLPGLEMAAIKGNGDIGGFPNEGPEGEVLDRYLQLQKNDFLSRPAAVPMIAVPNPFDAAVTLERIQTQMHTWIAMQLLDAAFSAQLDRSFQSAISAYRLNQPKVGKQQIETMRALIKKEQPNLGQDEEHESDKSQGKDDGKKALIDRLAAQVLDFDLQYVSKRMGGDKDD